MRCDLPLARNCTSLHMTGPGLVCAMRLAVSVICSEWVISVLWQPPRSCDASMLHTSSTGRVSRSSATADLSQPSSLLMRAAYDLAAAPGAHRASAAGRGAASLSLVGRGLALFGGGRGGFLVLSAGPARPPVKIVKQSLCQNPPAQPP